MAVCQHCSAELPVDAKFCGHCGERVIQKTTCARCGAARDAADKFCSICGYQHGQHSAQPVRKAQTKPAQDTTASTPARSIKSSLLAEVIGWTLVWQIAQLPDAILEFIDYGELYDTITLALLLILPTGVIVGFITWLMLRPSARYFSLGRGVVATALLLVMGAYGYFSGIYYDAYWNLKWVLLLAAVSVVVGLLARRKQSQIGFGRITAIAAVWLVAYPIAILVFFSLDVFLYGYSFQSVWDEFLIYFTAPY